MSNYSLCGVGGGAAVAVTDRVCYTVRSMNKLFVFGSFSQGMIHSKKLDAHVVARQTATVRGTLMRLPSGLTVLVNDGSHAVVGERLELTDAESLFSRLDLFYGVRGDQDLFYRAEVFAQTEGEAATETVSVYAANPRKIPRGTSAIDGADWRRSLTENPPLFAKLTEKQRTYIQRLGGCSARDIVPIDLPLYRELLHLEIVVDKGRRLALTPLGHELFRMLT